MVVHKGHKILFPRLMFKTPEGGKAVNDWISALFHIALRLAGKRG